MKFPEGYNPTQLLEFCQHSVFDKADVKYLVQKILAEIVVQRDRLNLIENLNQIIQDHVKISSGEVLRSIADKCEVGNEFDGGLDGIAAMCYHLDLHTVRRGIAALKKIEDRMTKS